MTATWSDPGRTWSDPYTGWSGGVLVPFKLGVDVAIGHPEGMWSLGVTGRSELGTTTRLAATSDVPGIWLPLDCDLIEVSWASGTNAKPPFVLARPDPGTCDLTLADPDLKWLPPLDPQAGLRPGRALRVVNRADHDRVLWYGWLETLTWDRGHDDPLHRLRVTAVDTMTLLVNGPQVDGLPVQTAAARAAAVLAYRPEMPAATIDPAATYTVAPVDSPTGLWDALLDASEAEIGYLWVQRDGGVRLLAHETSLGMRAEWAVPHCSPVNLTEQGYDLMDIANTWTVTRRKHDDTDVPVPQEDDNPDAVDAYGVWARTVTDWPAADDSNTARAAALGATAKGWPLASFGAVRVNVAASGMDPALVDVVCLAELGDRIRDVEADGPSRVPPLLIVGWQWTWTAAGALDGEISTAPPPDLWATSSWLLGVPERSEVGLTTVLGG